MLTSTHSKLIGTRHHKHFKISTHHTNIEKNYTGFQSNKESSTNSCLLTYKTLTNQQPTYLYNSLSFPLHSVSTRSSDSLVLSIPYVRPIITWQKGFLCHQSTTLEIGIHYLLIPEIRILYQSSVPGSKHTSSKLHFLPRLFPISLDCLPGF